MRALLIATIMIGFAPCLSQAEDLHSAVISRVSADHARDLKAGSLERKVASVERKASPMRREAHASSGSSKRIEKPQRHERR